MNIRTLFQPQSLTARQSTGILILRVVAGLAFMHHGWGKIQHPFDWMGPGATMPAFFQGLAALSEFGGGLAWIVGLLTPLAALGIASTMIVAIRLHAIVMHNSFVSSKPGEMSYELAAVYLCVALLLIFTGPGKFSLDQAFFRKSRF
ncbi:MAG: DoxX family protein [Verrucomicrobiota bacterium]